MKSSIGLFTLILVIFSQQLTAQKPIFTKSKVESVKVYRNAAELNNSVAFAIPAGTSEVVIGNISPYILEKTLQFGLNNKSVSILSSQFTQDYVSDYEIDETNPKIKRVTDSVKIVEELITKNRIELEANSKAVELLDKNQTVLVGSNTSTVNQLTELTNYYTNKRIELSNKIETIRKQGTELQKQLTYLKNNLKTNEEKESEKLASGKLVLRLMSKSATSINMNLNYLSNNASWNPYYEIKGEKISQPLEVIFKAMVVQNSGLDWKGVNLTLINGVASQNKTAPEVQPWFLSSYRQDEIAVTGYRDRKKEKYVGSADMATNYQIENAAPGLQVEESSVQFNINSNQLNVSYDVDIPYDILSNNKEHLISLFSQQIPATFEYYTAPNFSPEAFLMAKVTDFSQYGLVSAPASIVFENMYVGQTTINPNQTNDELDITLGNDKRISVKRVNIKDKSGEKFLSNYKEKTITYDLEIKNNKKEAISIKVKDRIPLSTQENIKIELLEDSKPTVDAEKGFLTWDIKLASSETKKLRVSYKVRHPKDVTVGL